MAKDISSNRAARKWTKGEQVGRVFWALVWPLFRLSPRVFWGWRRMLLRLFGAKVGRDAHIYPSVRVTIPRNLDIGDEVAVGDHAILYALGPIRIGARATISQYAHLCAGTHDWRDPAMPLVKTPLVIGEDAWICADAFVGPGVTVGEGAVLGARGVAMKNLEAGAIYGGNPAQRLNSSAE